MLAAVWALPGRPPGHVRGRLDLPGSISVTAGTAALVAAVILGEEHGFAVRATLGCFGLAAASFVLFVLVERRAEEPVVPLDVFRVRPVTVANGLVRPGGRGAARRRCSSSRCTCSGCSA